MGIRRKPVMEQRLAKAIQKYHEHGPVLVVELEDEVERLREQVVRLKTHVAKRDSGGTSNVGVTQPVGRGAQLVAALRS